EWEGHGLCRPICRCRHNWICAKPAVRSGGHFGILNIRPAAYVAGAGRTLSSCCI
ncbi:uncharacterized protein METZ01_LOCUS112269, partial [marine metagenome]